MNYSYNSADNHVDLLWTPKGVWQDRVANRFKDRAPKVVETDQGTYWEWEGKTRAASADGRDNAKHRQSYFGSGGEVVMRKSLGVETPEGSLPPSDPKVLLEHMDSAGIYASATYGPTRKWDIADSDLLLECYRAYNDFILEFSSADPDRIIGLPNLPTRLPEACAAEVERVARLGAKGLEFSMFDAAQPPNEEVWEPVWAAAEAAGLPICCHIGDKSGTAIPTNRRGSALAHFSVVPFVAARPIAQVVMGGILERHPGLRFSFAECRVGWLPFLISWMDRQAQERPPDPTVSFSMLPSEYINRQVTFTFEEDLVGARLIPEPWAYIRESAMWGCDYPHNRITWPNPKPIMEKLFEGVDPSLKREVVFDRMARFYALKVPVAT